MIPMLSALLLFFFFFSSRRRHTRYWRDWSSDVCSSDLRALERASQRKLRRLRGLLLAVVGRLGDQRRLDAALDGLLGHHALLDVAAGGQLELDLEQDLLDDRAQAAGARLALERAVGDGLERVVGEDQLDPVEAEEPLELLDDGVARLGEDRDQVLARELVHGGGHRQAAD